MFGCEWRLEKSNNDMGGIPGESLTTGRRGVQLARANGWEDDAKSQVVKVSWRAACDFTVVLKTQCGSENDVCRELFVLSLRRAMEVKRTKMT